MFGFRFPLVGLGGMVRPMKRACGVGVVAAVAAGVLVSGCSGSEGAGEGKGSASASASPSVSVTAVEPVPEETEPVFPATPAGDLNRRALEEGWVVDSLYEEASDFVEDICVSMTDQDGFGTDPGNWLATRVTGDEPAVLRAGMPTMCPKWSKVALKALGGEYTRVYPDGTWVVKAKPADPDPNEDGGEIGPGRYRVEGDLEDCYWERTSRSGEILDNSFATSAQEITVTVRGSDGQFTSEGCGTWKPVK